MGDAPLSWNAPSITFSSDEDLGTLMKERGTDQLLPLGLYGVPHQFLRESESGSEVEWAITNQWRTGSVDRGFAPPPLILLPADSLAPHSRGDFPLARPVRIVRAGKRSRAARPEDGALETISDSAPHYLTAIDVASLHAKSADVVSRAVMRTCRRVLRLREDHAPDIDVALMTIVRSEEDLPLLEVLLDALAVLRSRADVRLQPLPAPDSWPQVHGRTVGWQSPRASEPDAQAAAARVRRNRTTRLSRRETLETIAAHGAGATEPERTTAHRNFDASMMGEISLAGPGPDALFSGGHFGGFGTGQDRFVLPTRSFLLDGRGRSLALEPVTCFSFESDDATGLRSDERLRPTRGRGAEPTSDATRFVSEYSFVGSLPVLVSTHALFAGPDLGHDAELLHLAWRLPDEFSFGIGASYGKQWGDQITVNEETGCQEAFGTKFLVQFQDFSLGIAFLTPEGLPLISSIGVFAAPEPVLVLGGRFDLGPSVARGNAAEFALLIAHGDGSDAAEDPGSQLERILSGRLPAALGRELASGHVLTPPSGRTG